MALVVLTGGARSGKSALAQSLAQSRASQYASVQVAVFGRESDTEMTERIARHQQGRPESFETLEVSDPTDFLGGVADDGLLVLDCLGTLLGRLLEQVWEDAASSSLADAEPDMLPEGVAEAASAAFDAVVAAIAARTGDTIVVTNEVGSGLVPSHASGRLFRDLLGRGNRMLAESADATYLCVAGRALRLSDLPTTVTWPQD